MRKQISRVISLCLCICMLAAWLPASAQAEGVATIYDSDSFFTPIRDEEGNDTTVVTKEATPSNVILDWGDGYGLQIQSTKTGSDANGSSAKLVSGMTGTIGFDYTPIPNVAEDGSATYAFRKLTFRFTDLENGNSFDYIVHNYSKWASFNSGYAITGVNDNGLMGYVSYQGNVRAYERFWDSANNCQSWWLWDKMSTSEDGKNTVLPPYGGFQMGTFIGTTQNTHKASFTWNATEKQILVRDYGYDWGGTDVVLADLDDPEAGFAGFSGFDYYSVEIIFDEVQTDCQAGVLIYAVNMPVYVTLEKDGADKLYFSASQAARTDIHAPIVMEDSMGEKTYLEDALTGTVKAIDMETGLIETAGGNPNVNLFYKKQGTEDALAVLDAMVVASAEKDVTYEVYATVTDGNGNTSEPARVAVCGGKKPTYYDSDTFFESVKDTNGNDTTVVTAKQTPAFTAKAGDYGLQIMSTGTGSAADGSSAKLVSGMTGDIAFDYAPIPVVTGEDKGEGQTEWWETTSYAFRKLTFRFTDLESGDYFDYVVHNYDSIRDSADAYEYWKYDYNVGIASYVEYHGVASTTMRDWTNEEVWLVHSGFTTLEDGSKLPPRGGDAIGSFRGTGPHYSIWEGQNYRVANGQGAKFRWDAAEKQILVTNPNSSHGWNNTAIVADLDDSAYGFEGFTGFDYYSVELIFDEVQDDCQAGVLINSVTMPAYGFSLWCDRDNSKNPDIHAPIVINDCIGKLDSLKGALTAEIRAIDLETGVIRAKADEAGVNKVEFWYKEQGTDDSSLVTLDNNTVEPVEAGAYEVYAKVTDKSENESAVVRVAVYQIGDMLTVGDNAIGYATGYVKDGDTLPTGYYEDKYIIGWTLDGNPATNYESAKKGRYVAEYVDTDMLKVWVQDNSDAIEAGSAVSRESRFVASVNSLHYQTTGFVFSLTNQTPTVGGEKCKTKDTTVVYQKLYVGKDLKEAKDLYTDGYSQYLCAFTMKEIPEDAKFYVCAFVQLFDGTYIYGKTRFVSMSQTITMKEAKDAGMEILGRYIFNADESVSLYWQSSLRLKFTGSFLKLAMGNTVPLGVKVDGGELLKPDVTTNPEEIVLAENLDFGTHEVEVYCLSRSKDPVFKCFMTDGAGEILAPDEVKTIEIIGDSITEGYIGAGYSNTVDATYGFLAAEALSYGHNSLGRGGIRLTAGDNAAEYDPTGMADRYFLTGECDSTAADIAWDTTQYQPDYLVINLGSNDWNRIDVDGFITTYRTFLDELRAAYPDSVIFVMQPFQTYQTYFGETILDMAEQKGDSKIVPVRTEGWITINDTADRVHPTPEGHRKAGEKLAEVIRAYVDSQTASTGE